MVRSPPAPQSCVSRGWDAGRLDLRAFARAAAELSERGVLRDYGRLLAEAQGRDGGSPVRWHAVGALRPVVGAAAQVWLELTVEAVLPLVCQRCLGPLEVPMSVRRAFRFVADEAAAEAEDDGAEEDVLVLSRAFDLRALVEDEVLMALPLAPCHQNCPTKVRLGAADPGLEPAGQGRPHPFAALAGLRRGSEEPRR